MFDTLTIEMSDVIIGLLISILAGFISSSITDYFDNKHTANHVTLYVFLSLQSLNFSVMSWMLYWYIRDLYLELFKEFPNIIEPYPYIDELSWFTILGVGFLSLSLILSHLGKRAIRLDTKLQGKFGLNMLLLVGYVSPIAMFIYFMGLGSNI